MSTAAKSFKEISKIYFSSFFQQDVPNRGFKKGIHDVFDWQMLYIYTHTHMYAYLYMYLYTLYRECWYTSWFDPNFKMADGKHKQTETLISVRTHFTSFLASRVRILDPLTHPAHCKSFAKVVKWQVFNKKKPFKICIQGSCIYLISTYFTCVQSVHS